MTFNGSNMNKILDLWCVSVENERVKIEFKGEIIKHKNNINYPLVQTVV